MRRGSKVETAQDRFLSKIEKKDSGCWIWTGVTRNGYGQICVGQTMEYAHRFSWEMHNQKKIPKGHYACHTCDNPRCVNPEHIFIGTPTQNVRDCINKGRAPRRERHGQAKLTEEQVAEIKVAIATGEIQKSIANRYGVCRQTIGLIKSGRNWSDVCCVAHIKEIAPCSSTPDAQHAGNHSP